MKTTEIFKTIDDYLTTINSFQEQQNIIRKNLKQQKEALEQQIKDLDTVAAFEIFKVQNEENIKLSNEAFEKIMAFIKSIDDDRVNKAVSQFERGIITQLELIHQFKRLTAEMSFDAEIKLFSETNW
jgi:transcription antitermination factor NusG